MFSYQLYSSRHFPPLTETLKMLSAAGYEDTEGFGGLYADKDKLAALAAGLKANKLGMSTGHFGLQMIEENPKFVLEIARTLGMKKVYCPNVKAADRPTDGKGWRDFGKRLQKAGRKFRDAGLGFGWHNHDFEFADCADGSVPMFEILKGGPKLEWEIDVAWVIRGGADPIAWIKAYGARITAANVKDIAPQGEAVSEDGWADVGHGTVDWKGIMAALKATNCTYFVMEHDNPADDKRFATRALTAAKKL